MEAGPLTSSITDMSTGVGSQMSVRFELFSDDVGRYRFRIIAPNGHVVAVSAPYECKAGAKAAITMVRSGALAATLVDSTRHQCRDTTAIPTRRRRGLKDSGTSASNSLPRR